MTADDDKQPAPALLRELRKRAGMSRDNLAKAIGMARGNSLARYEDPDYWTAARFPSDFVAKIAYALVGRGSPQITSQEVWALSDDATSVVLTSAVILIPVAKWPVCDDRGVVVDTREIVGQLRSDESSDGEHMAFIVNDNHAAPRIMPGARVIVRVDQTIPAPGCVFMVALNGVVEARRYRSNPERWESLAEPARETIYPQGAIQVIGRVWRSVTDFE